MFRSCLKTRICLEGDDLSRLHTGEVWNSGTCWCTPSFRGIYLSTDHEVAVSLSVHVMSQSCLSWFPLKQELRSSGEVVPGCLRRVLNLRLVLVSRLISLHSNVASFLPAAFQIGFCVLLIGLCLWLIPDPEHRCCQKRCSVEICSAHQHSLPLAVFQV